MNKTQMKRDANLHVLDPKPGASQLLDDRWRKAQMQAQLFTRKKKLAELSSPVRETCADPLHY